MRVAPRQHAVRTCCCAPAHLQSTPHPSPAGYPPPTHTCRLTPDPAKHVAELAADVHPRQAAALQRGAVELVQRHTAARHLSLGVALAARRVAGSGWAVTTLWRCRKSATQSVGGLGGNLTLRAH